MGLTHIGDAKTRMEITFPAKKKMKPSGWRGLVDAREDAVIDSVGGMEKMSGEPERLMPPVTMN